MATDCDKANLLNHDNKPQVRWCGRHCFGRASVGLGATLIILGCITIIAQIAVLVFHDQSCTRIPQGIWCGVSFIICGIFGIIAGKHRSIPWILIHLVLCIIVCFFATAIIGLSVWTAAADFNFVDEYRVAQCDNTPPVYIGQPLPGKELNESDLRHGRLGLYDYHEGVFYRRRVPCSFHVYNAISLLRVVQFTMDMLMGVLGLLTAIVAILLQDCPVDLCAALNLKKKRVCDVTGVPSDSAKEEELVINMNAQG